VHAADVVQGSWLFLRAAARTVAFPRLEARPSRFYAAQASCCGSSVSCAPSAQLIYQLLKKRCRPFRPTFSRPSVLLLAIANPVFGGGNSFTSPVCAAL